MTAGCLNLQARIRYAWNLFSHDIRWHCSWSKSRVQLYSQLNSGGDDTIHNRFILGSKRKVEYQCLFLWQYSWQCLTEIPLWKVNHHRGNLSWVFLSTHNAWTGLQRHRRGDSRNIVKIGDEVCVDALGGKGERERIHYPVARSSTIMSALLQYRRHEWARNNRATYL